MNKNINNFHYKSFWVNLTKLLRSYNILSKLSIRTSFKEPLEQNRSVLVQFDAMKEKWKTYEILRLKTLDLKILKRYFSVYILKRYVFTLVTNQTKENLKKNFGKLWYGKPFSQIKNFSADIPSGDPRFSFDLLAWKRAWCDWCASWTDAWIFLVEPVWRSLSISKTTCEK